MSAAKSNILRCLVLRRKLRECRTEYDRLTRTATRIELRRQRIMQRSMKLCRRLDAIYYAQNMKAEGLR